MKKTLLIVEDDTLYKDQLVALLERDFQIRWAPTLTDALRAMDEASFDAVLLDLHLPDTVRGDAVHRIKHAKPAALVIAMSGNEDPELIRASVATNASGYYVKGRDDVNGRAMIQNINCAISLDRTCRKLEEAKNMMRRNNILGDKMVEVHSQFADVVREVCETMETAKGKLSPV